MASGAEIAAHQAGLNQTGGNFTVYKSSAGSGKTFTLVKEYLRIALGDPNEPPSAYKGILAITFTNKAAGEMKERVVTTLLKLSDETTAEPMMEMLSEELNITREIISRRAAALLNAILHSYSEFSIGTIDSFVHRIVRTFALDLKLPFNFNIETNRDLVLARCVDELARKIGEDETITKVLVEFSKNQVEEDRSWRVDEELLSFSKKLLNEDGMVRMEKIRNAEISSLMQARSQMNEFGSEFASVLKNKGALVLDWMLKQGLEAVDFYQTTKGIWNFYRKISNGEFDDSIINSYINKSIHEKKWKSGKSRLTDDHIKFLEDEFHAIESFRLAGKEKYFTYKALLRNIYSLMVISEIEKILTSVKAEENIVFISEFNRMISEIVKSEPVPFVFERIGEKYKHFLLDEFQDTSVLQWHNILPLVDNSLANGNFNLVVGDGKQSIYRWRGGEVEQFAGLPSVPGAHDAILREREDSLKRNYTEKLLSKNFRSKENVVEFNNKFYGWLKDNVLPEKFKKVYAALEQEGREDKTGGLVTFDLIPYEEDEDVDFSVCRSAEKYVRQNTEELGYDLADITVLVRNKNSGKKVADHLLSVGIPIVSSESLLLAANESVGALAAFLHLVHEERAPVHEAKVLNYLVSKKLFAEKRFSDVWEEFYSSRKNLTQFLLAQNICRLDREHLSSLPLFDLCSVIIRELNLSKHDPLFVQFFLDEVLKYSRTNRESLSAFLDWWKQNGHSCSAVLPLGANAVNIMTIHASKGLQFPVVIIPFADWENYKSDFLWVDLEEKDLPQLKTTMVNSASQLAGTPYEAVGGEEKNKQVLDNVNLLYVATTRAEDHLHIISRSRNSSKYVDKWLSEFFSTNTDKANGENCYLLGTPGKKAAVSKNEHTAFRHAFELHDRTDILELKLSASDHAEIPLREEKREDGIVFHQAMSKIYKAADADKIYSRLSASGICSSEKAKKIDVKITALFKNKFFADLFPPDAHSVNEPEILSESVNLRPDRVVFLADETWVIDYKTGGENSAYLAQISRYADALEQMNYPPVRKFIVYVEEEKLEEVI